MADGLLLSAYDDDDDDIFARVTLDAINPFYTTTFYKKGIVNIHCDNTNFATRVEVLGIDKKYARNTFGNGVDKDHKEEEGVYHGLDNDHHDHD